VIAAKTRSLQKYSPVGPVSKHSIDGGLQTVRPSFVKSPQLTFSAPLLAGLSAFLSALLGSFWGRPLATACRATTRITFGAEVKAVYGHVSIEHHLFIPFEI
jgi:hypothetical protein